MFKCIPGLDRELFREQVFVQNISRLLLFVKLAILLTLSHVIYFAVGMADPGSIEYSWRLWIISFHAGILLSSMIIWGLVRKYRRAEFWGAGLMNSLLYAYILYVILTGVGIVVVDQLVTAAITPFLIVCTIVALAFLIPPGKALVLFGLAYLAFFFLLPLTQNEPSILLSNRVNGITAIGVGFFLSVLLWRNFENRAYQSQIIDKQSLDLQQRNTELLRERRKLETAISARDQFFSIIAHDLKTPFHSLLGFSEILKNEWENLDEKEKLEIVQMIKDSSEGAFQLLLNLLDWARLQKQRIELKPVDIGLRMLVNQVLDQLGAQASLKGIKFDVDIPSDLVMKGDEHMITSVFRNLASNAIKFSPKGSRVEISARIRKTLIHCLVRDYGVGIPEKDLRRIFRLSQSTSGTENEQGTGLGLHLCREFVRKHKGRIWVKSRQGEGATFNFCFPLPE
jgi:two-component system, sensor histidine kinase and response regulator